MRQAFVQSWARVALATGISTFRPFILSPVTSAHGSRPAGSPNQPPLPDADLMSPKSSASDASIEKRPVVSVVPFNSPSAAQITPGPFRSVAELPVPPTPIADVSLTKPAGSRCVGVPSHVLVTLCPLSVGVGSPLPLGLSLWAFGFSDRRSFVLCLASRRSTCAACCCV